MTPAELDELDRLASEATPGLWVPKRDGRSLWEINALTEDMAENLICTACDEGEAAFIAASRTAIPALVAEVRRLREALEKVPVLGCGDSSCSFQRPRGMATNGGCRCVDEKNHYAQLKKIGEACKEARAALEGK